ncbi:MAG: AsmA-like C-terminal region-containing protein [Deltaproteobacteria bacterium]|nr:AsmA-like C-terminal region-containing protein [Deltaproteobacteria bacterium]
MGNIGFGPLKAAGAFRAGDLYVNSGDLSLKYGKVRFKGHLKRGETPEAEVSAYLNLTRVPIEALPKRFAALKEYMVGDMSLQGLVYVKGANKTAWLSSLTGGTNLIIENGVIKRSSVFIKILEFLSIENLLTRDKSGGSGKGLRFDKIEGPIDFENGVAELKQIRLRGPVLNAIGRGKVDLIKGRVDGEVGVEPLGTIDMVISHIPILGHLLTGDKKALYVDYFKVDGPLSDPDVRYIPFKSLSSGTIGFIKRLFMSPGRFFKSVSDRKRDFDRKGLPYPSTLEPENDMGP